MSTKVYIRTYCNSCFQVLQYIRQNKIKCRVINLDTSPAEEPILVVPALIKNGELIAYGLDIIKHL